MKLLLLDLVQFREFRPVLRMLELDPDKSIARFTSHQYPIARPAFVDAKKLPDSPGSCQRNNNEHEESNLGNSIVFGERYTSYDDRKTTQSNRPPA